MRYVTNSKLISSILINLICGCLEFSCIIIIMHGHNQHHHHHQYELFHSECFGAIVYIFCCIDCA